MVQRLAKLGFYGTDTVAEFGNVRESYLSNRIFLDCQPCGKHRARENR